MKTSYIENRRDIIFHVMPFINLIKKLLYECVLEYLLGLILVIPRLFYQSHASDISSVCMLRVKDMSNEVCNFKLVELAILDFCSSSLNLNTKNKTYKIVTWRLLFHGYLVKLMYSGKQKS